METLLKIEIPDEMLLPTTVRISSFEEKYFETTLKDVNFMGLHIDEVVFHIEPPSPHSVGAYKAYDVLSVLPKGSEVGTVILNFRYEGTVVKVLCYRDFPDPDGSKLYTYTIHSHGSLEFEDKVDALFDKFKYVLDDNDPFGEYVPLNV